MTTRLQDLPEATASFVVATNEDWYDSLAYTDADGNPIPLDGIRFDMMVRRTAGSAVVILSMSTEATLDGGVPDGTLTPSGVSGNVLGIVVPLSAVELVPVSALTQPCVFDLVGRGDGLSRRLLSGSVQFDQGVTR